MNVADIQIFSKVAATGSFTEAALQLGITRSAVSKSVARLEASLGVRLLNRSPRSASLTEAGRTFYQHSLEVDEALERAVASVNGADQQPRGTVSCSLPSSLGAALMPSLMTSFRAAWPDISLSLHFDDRYTDLVGSSIDVAIRVAQKLNDSSLLSRRIGTTREVLAASPGYLERHGTPQSVHELRSHRCLSVGNAVRRRKTWHFDSDDGPLEVSVQCQTTSNSVLALILAACMHDGIIYVPELFVGNELSQGRLMRILPQATAARNCNVYAVYPSLNPPAKMRAFSDCGEQELPRLDAVERWSPLSRLQADRQAADEDPARKT